MHNTQTSQSSDFTAVLSTQACDTPLVQKDAPQIVSTFLTPISGTGFTWYQILVSIEHRSTGWPKKSKLSYFVHK